MEVDPNTILIDGLALHGWVPALPRSLHSSLKPQFAPQPSEAVLLPSSPLSQYVLEYAKANLPLPTLHHSLRVFQYCLLVLPHLPPPIPSMSPETVFVASLLHDIGTTVENMTGTRLSFEFWGGIKAGEVVKSGGGSDKVQTEGIMEAIWRHQEVVGEEGFISALGMALQISTLLDNIGDHADLIHPDTIAAIVKEYPRLKWSHCFAKTAQAEMKLKPWSHTTVLGEEFPKNILANKVMNHFEDAEGDK
ncbi:MAG: hypothetical protein M1834_001765 [Cirrosporium novae-zelandiae]|nr:MAG: hypothetical protein M1834_001765 [Cirrosporium novae-zelandiae]